MKRTFTLTELYAHRGCYSKEMINYCVRGERSVSLDFILNHNEVKLTEKAWFISNNTELTPHEHSALAYGCASIAVDMYEATYPHTFVVPDSLNNEASIQHAMNIAGKHNQQYGYAIYAACARDPYDRIYSACKAIELAGGEWIDKMLECLKGI